MFLAFIFKAKNKIFLCSYHNKRFTSTKLNLCKYPSKNNITNYNNKQFTPYLTKNMTGVLKC